MHLNRNTNIPEADYTAAIPDCCQFRTAQEHADQLGLCWGLLSHIKTGSDMKCTEKECPYATRQPQTPRTPQA